jgi:hypothetical protein
MGFYYILMFLIGVGFLIAGALNKKVSSSVKIVSFLFVFGVLFIAGSVLLMMPGSSDIIAELLKK